MVIGPKRGWFDLKLKDIWLYRDLVFHFVRRDFVAFYKQTILGPLWYIIQPLLTTLVFTVIFGKVARISTDGVPPFLFYLSGTVAWGYFSNCLKETSDTFIKNSKIFGKVYFPRLTVPLSVVIINLAKFGIQFLLFLGFRRQAHRFSPTHAGETCRYAHRDYQGPGPLLPPGTTERGGEGHLGPDLSGQAEQCPDGPGCFPDRPGNPRGGRDRLRVSGCPPLHQPGISLHLRGNARHPHLNIGSGDYRNTGI